MHVYLILICLDWRYNHIKIMVNALIRHILCVICIKSDDNNIDSN